MISTFEWKDPQMPLMPPDKFDFRYYYKAIVKVKDVWWKILKRHNGYIYGSWEEGKGSSLCNTMRGGERKGK